MGIPQQNCLVQPIRIWITTKQNILLFGTKSGLESNFPFHSQFLGGTNMIHIQWNQYISSARISFPTPFFSCSKTKKNDSPCLHFRALNWMSAIMSQINRIRILLVTCPATTKSIFTLKWSRKSALLFLTLIHSSNKNLSKNYI